MAGLIINCINVFLIFFAVGYFFSGMITDKLNQRKNKIADSIHSAKTNKEEALLSKEEYERRIREFETEHQAIMAKARERAELTEKRILKEADMEAQRIVTHAQREAELKKQKTKDEVKMDMIHISEKLAEKFIAEGMDEERQRRWIRYVLDKMGDQTWQSL